MVDINPLEMSDEDFGKIPPTEFKAPVETQEPKPIEEVKKEEEKPEDNQDDKNKSGDEDNENNSDSDNSDDDKGDDKSKSEDNKDEDKPEDKSEKPLDGKESEKPVKEGEKPTDADKKDEPKPEVVNYEEAYKKITAPFKANGKEIKVNNVDEAIRLMQAGAGFARKLQNLQPHLKTVRMLEDANLLDPNELSYLIDLHQKKPDAIKKLIKDSGIDPLDLNTNDDVTYKPTDRTVSDNDLAFRDVLDTVSSTDQGKELIGIINSSWDQKAKNALYGEPKLLEVIQSQYENGLYDQIVAEIDRQKLMGTISANETFFTAYKTAGDYLVSQDKLKPAVKDNNGLPSGKQPTIIETRTASVKSQVKNDEKARAASPTNSTSRKAASTVNPLSVDDETFMKQFSGRV